MKLYDENGKLIDRAIACKQPKFTHHRGRTWDCKTKYIDDVEVEWWYDSTWGRNFYFEWNGKWYKTPIIREDYTDGLQQYKEKLMTRKTVV